MGGGGGIRTHGSIQLVHRRPRTSTPCSKCVRRVRRYPCLYVIIRWFCCQLCCPHRCQFCCPHRCQTSRWDFRIEERSQLRGGTEEVGFEPTARSSTSMAVHQRPLSAQKAHRVSTEV